MVIGSRVRNLHALPLVVQCHTKPLHHGTAQGMRVLRDSSCSKYCYQMLLCSMNAEHNIFLVSIFQEMVPYQPTQKHSYDSCQGQRCILTSHLNHQLQCSNPIVKHNKWKWSYFLSLVNQVLCTQKDRKVQITFKLLGTVGSLNMGILNQTTENKHCNCNRHVRTYTHAHTHTHTHTHTTQTPQLRLMRQT